MDSTITKDINVPVKKFRFTVQDYHRLGEAGIITPDQKVELINGEIIERSPIKSPHSGTVSLLNRLLSHWLGKDYIIHVQNPLEIDKFTEPEPDVMVLKFREDFYIKSHPKPEDTLLLIEVADSSLEKDRAVKLPLYAAAGIPEVWIVNLQDQQIEVSTEPSSKGYANCHIYRKGDKIQTDLLKTLAVNDVFIEV